MENKRSDYEAYKKEAAERLKKGGSMLGKVGDFTKHCSRGARSAECSHYRCLAEC